MRAFRPTCFRISRFNRGWRCYAEGLVLVATRLEPIEINLSVFGRIRFFTYIRGVLALRKKARTLRAPPGARAQKDWLEDFID